MNVDTLPTGQAGDSLRLPDSAFSPATMDSQVSGSIDTTLADQEPFRQNHSSPYESWGWQAGYYQRADWSPPGYSAADVITFRYMGGVFSSAASAAAAWLDGVSYTQSQLGATRVSCTGISSQCADLTYSVRNGGAPSQEEYSLLAVGSCLIEASVVASQAASGVSGQIQKTLSSIDSAAQQAAASACSSNVQPQTSPTPGTSSPADFTILSVRAEQPKSHPDWNLVKPPLRVVKVGAKVLLSVYYHVSGAQPNLAYTETVTVTHNGATEVQQTFPDQLGSDPVDTYRNSWTFTPSTAGSYTITIAVTIGDQTQSLSTALTVRKKAPPKPAKTSFSLVRVQLLDLQGRPTSSFRVGAQFSLLLNYTVRNLHARTMVYIAVTFELPGTGKALYVPTQVQMTAVNGQQSYRTKFFVPNRPGSVLKIVAGLTIGSTTHQKSTSLSISG